MDYLAIITGLLSKAYKLDEGKIAELTKEGENITTESVLASILEEDATRVAALKKATDTTGKFQEGYAKAKKEERMLFEKEIKEQFQIESDTTGLDLINEVVTTKSEELGKGKKGEITEDDVKKHSVYQTLESRYKKDLKSKDDEWQTKLTEIQSNYKKEETFSAVKSKALSILEGLKPVLPGDPTVANNQKGWFVGALKDYEFDLQDDRVVVMKEGKVIEDNHGNSLGFDELVKSTASKFFEFQKNNGGGNAGNNNDGAGASGGSTGYPAGVTKPKTFEELAKILNDESIKTEDRQIVYEVYEKENGK